MTYGLTTDKNEIDEVIQEFYLYILQCNPDTLKRIYEKDGEKGLIRYSAVVIKRSLQSKNSRYYYKFKKYYTRIDSMSSNSTYDITENGELSNPKNLYNLPEKAGISRNSLFTTIDNVRNLIKEKLND